MSEMQANQYFISGRYSEAFSEYSKLSFQKQNDINIKEKMLISATLDEEFEHAMRLLIEIITKKNEINNKITIDYSECPCSETVAKLEKEIKQKNNFNKKIVMKIAILNFLDNPEKSKKYFKKLKDSVYGDIVEPIFKYTDNDLVIGN